MRYNHPTPQAAEKKDTCTAHRLEEWVRVVGLYDKTSDCYAPSMREQDSFYFRSLCPRPFHFSFLVWGVCLFHFEICFRLSFLVTLLFLLIYEIMVSSLFCYVLSTSRPLLYLFQTLNYSCLFMSNTSSLSTSYFSSPLVSYDTLCYKRTASLLFIGDGVLMCSIKC